MNRLGLILLLLPLGLPSLASAAPTLLPDGTYPWEPVKEAKGIIVDRRKVNGSPLKEFRGRGVVEAPVADILAVFRDVEKATEWMDSCNASKMVDDVNDRMKIVYNRTHAPWPVSDRDAVLRNVLTFDEKERRVSIEFTGIADPRSAPVKGVVRMPFVRGHWFLWPAEGGKTTRVEYQVHASPGGALPNWLVNYASRDLPFKTVAGLRAQVKRRHYPDIEKYLVERFSEYPFLLGKPSEQKPSL